MRDGDLLESAAAMPFAGFGDELLHKDVFEMAAAYAFHLTKNHAFVDGNKRIATLAALTFLEVNGIVIDVDDDALASIIEQVATGSVEKQDLALFFQRAVGGPSDEPGEAAHGEEG